MKINTENLISISEANQNLSKVVKKLEKTDCVVILKNNKPKYLISNYTEMNWTENDIVELVARRILDEHKSAFEVLSK